MWRTTTLHRETTMKKKTRSRGILSGLALGMTLLAGAGHSGSPRVSGQVVAALSASLPADPYDVPPPMPATMAFPSTLIEQGTSVGYLPASWDVSATGSFDYTI